MKKRLIMTAVVLLASLAEPLFTMSGVDLVVSIYLSFVFAGLYSFLWKKKSALLLGILNILLVFIFPRLASTLIIAAFGIAAIGPRGLEYYPLAILFIASLFALPPAMPFGQKLFTWLAMVASVFVKASILSGEEIEKSYQRLLDDSSKREISLAHQKEEVVRSREFELQNVILKERNRIASDIHDNLGHLLTRTILQLGALKYMVKDDAVKTELDDISKTMNQAMNRVRESVHNIHDESMDFDADVRKIIDDFKFCPIVYRNTLKDALPHKVGSAMLYIVKEALTNTAKHSDANRVNISIYEAGGYYNFLIADNGSKKASVSNAGIGLESMEDRVAQIGGEINFSTDEGFSIFIRVSKNDEA